MRNPNEGSYGRYTAVAILLHWLIAIAIVCLLAAGVWMSDALRSSDPETQRLAFEVIQIHKAAGLTVLVLSVLRLVWRLLNPPPPLPSHMPGWQKFASDFSHFCFYGFMIGAPLLGWTAVSTSPEFSALPTTWFGLFTIPHLPIGDWTAALFGAAAAAALPELAVQGHGLIALLGGALLALHVGAALKHHYVDRDQVLARMAPWVTPREPVFEPPAPRAGGGARLAAAALLSLFGGGAAALFLWPGTGSAPPLAQETAAPLSVSSEPPADGLPLWTVAAEQSRIGFGGSNLGAGFSGAFERWRADIRFDPDRLAESRVRVEIETASAVTGDGQIDGALPQADFFDSAAHPVAVFESGSFSAGEGENAYLAEGVLTLKGRAAPVSFPFTLLIEGAEATMSGALAVDRIAYEIGLAADATGGMISRDIEVALEVTATRTEP